MLNRRLDSRPQPTPAEAGDARLGGNSIEDETGLGMSPPADDAALDILGEPAPRSSAWKASQLARVTTSATTSTS
jgi:hypothetical protein